MNRAADDFGDQTLHGQANARVFSGEGGKRTPHATDDVAAVSLDVRHGAQLVVQQIAGHRHAGGQATRQLLSLSQLLRESPTCLTQQRIDLSSWQAIREYLYELCQQRDIGLGEEQLDLRRQLEHLGGSSGPRPFPRTCHEAVPFHRCGLDSNGALGQPES